VNRQRQAKARPVRSAFSFRADSRRARRSATIGAVYGNGLNDWNTFTNDTEQDLLQVYDGATPIINRSHTRTDNLNLTNVWDTVTAANNQSYWHNASNKLQNANGPWGAKTFYYDGVGNRTQEISTVSAVTTRSRSAEPFAKP
jgi:hypothetical protein